MNNSKTPKGIDPPGQTGVTGRFRGVFRRARVVGSASKTDSDEPVVVFFGKADQSRSLRPSIPFCTTRSVPPKWAPKAGRG